MVGLFYSQNAYTHTRGLSPSNVLRIQTSIDDAIEGDAYLRTIVSCFQACLRRQVQRARCCKRCETLPTPSGAWLLSESKSSLERCYPLAKLTHLVSPVQCGIKA